MACEPLEWHLPECDAYTTTMSEGSSKEAVTEMNMATTSRPRFPRRPLLCPPVLVDIRRLAAYPARHLVTRSRITPHPTLAARRKCKVQLLPTTVARAWPSEVRQVGLRNGAATRSWYEHRAALVPAIKAQALRDPLRVACRPRSCRRGSRSTMTLLPAAERTPPSSSARRRPRPRRPSRRLLSVWSPMRGLRVESGSRGSGPLLVLHWEVMIEVGDPLGGSVVGKHI